MKISTKGTLRAEDADRSRRARRGRLHRPQGHSGAAEYLEKYLEQIVPILSRSGILRTNRGSQGGYALAKEPEHVTVGEILRLTEGSLSPVVCLDGDPARCPRSADCPTLPVWQGLNRVINEYLDGITLRSILDSQRERYINDYSI